jgi:hypothetical protein
MRAHEVLHAGLAFATQSWKIGGEGKLNQAVLDATQRVVYLSICKVDPTTSQETHLIRYLTRPGRKRQTPGDNALTQYVVSSFPSLRSLQHIQLEHLHEPSAIHHQQTPCQGTNRPHHSEGQVAVTESWCMLSSASDRQLSFIAHA